MKVRIHQLIYPVFRAAHFLLQQSSHVVDCSCR